MRRRGERQVRHFWNRLDRVIYGKAAERGCREQRWCFPHAGTHSDNYHVHFGALAPIDTLEFCALANTLWAGQHPATAGIDQNWITPVLYPDRVAGYVTREVWKLGSDSFDETISADTGVTYQNTTERLVAQGPAGRGFKPHQIAQLKLATIMAATASFDHRAIDGAVAAEFMRSFRELVETPIRLMM